MGLTVDNVVRGKDFLALLQFAPVSIMPPLLHTHRLNHSQCCVTAVTDSIINNTSWKRIGLSLILGSSYSYLVPTIKVMDAMFEVGGSHCGE